VCVCARARVRVCVCAYNYNFMCLCFRVLSYLFCDDHFMLPQDPLGRHGPSLEEFLAKTPKQPTKRAAREA
jgi:hypothetical protein